MAIDGREDVADVDGEVDGEKPGGPRSRKGAHTRARIVVAAKHVFEEHGFLEARIADIAERAELSHGAFYHYFDSKEAVFLEVAEAQERRFSQHSMMEIGFDGAVHDDLATLVQSAIRSFLEEYRAEARIMAVIEQVSRHHEPVRGVRLARYRGYLDLTEQSLEDLHRRGWIDVGLDPTIAAAAMVATVTRMAELWFVQSSLDCDFDLGVEQLTRVCLNILQFHPSDGAPDSSGPS
jgi:AcrR family transcriptional regulator